MYTEIPREKVYIQILEQIKSNIINKTIKSGDRLPSERVLAEQLGVSRATVREAIRSLEMIGLVNCRQGEGNFVAESFDNTLTEPLSVMFLLNNGNVMEIHELRRAVEVEAAKLAARNATLTHIENLNGILSSIESGEDESVNANLDKQFHYQIAFASNNSLIREVLNSATTLIEDFIKDLRIAILNDLDRAESINTQHRAIYEAIKNRDTDSAGEAMLSHMNFIEDYVNRIQSNR